MEHKRSRSRISVILEGARSVFQKDQFALLILLCISLGLILWKYNWFQVGSYWDDSEYVVLAKSILFGPDYGLINLPDNAVDPTRYPFGWPLILSLFYMLGGGDFQVLKIAPLLFTLINILIIWKGWMYIGIPDQLTGRIVAIAYGLSPMAVLSASELMSEPAFTSFMLLCMILTTKSNEKGGVIQPLFLGVAWIFVAYTRLLGFGFLAASLLFLVTKKKWKNLILATIGSTLTLLIIVTYTPINWHDPIDIEIYQSQFRNPSQWGQVNVPQDILARGKQGLSEYLTYHISESLIPLINSTRLKSMMAQIGLGFVLTLVTTSISAIVIAGYFVDIKRKGIYPIHLFLPIYTLILIIWPYRGARFLYPIQPMLFTYLLIGGLALYNLLSKQFGISDKTRKWNQTLGYGMFILLLTAQLFVITQRDDSLNHVRDFRIGTTWLKQNATQSQDVVIFAEQPQAIYLYSGIPTIELINNVSLLEETIHQKTVYVLIAPKLEWRNDGMLEIDQFSEKLLSDLRSGTYSADLVFEDVTSLVTIYQFRNSEAKVP